MEWTAAEICFTTPGRRSGTWATILASIAGLIAATISVRVFLGATVAKRIIYLASSLLKVRS